MATYAAYRHIELDKVGCGKKRIQNHNSSEITSVLSTPTVVTNGTTTPKRMSNGSSANSTPSVSRRGSHSDSFSRLFGGANSPVPKPTPRRASIPKQDVTNRNPVTGDGVDSWDNRHRTSPKVHFERNPVTGEITKIVTPPATPKKVVQNGYVYANGSTTPVENGVVTPVNGLVNGHNGGIDA